MGSDVQFRDLIRQVRARDPRAAEQLVREYEPYIRRAIRSRLRSRQLRRVLDSLDICQSVLASLFARTAVGEYELDTPDQLEKLLTRMVRNKVAGAWRRYSVRILGTDGLDLAQVPAAAADVGQAISAAELAAMIRQHLSEDEWLLLQMRNEGREWADIAREHGGTPESLRKKLSRSLETAAALAGVSDGTSADA